MAIKKGASWDADVKMPTFAPLKRNLEVDVAIIGGGITGITCAYLLSKTGKKVVLIEKNTLCTGATGATTAFLSRNIDTGLSELIEMVGKNGTKIIAESHQYAIDNIEKIIKQNKINCEFMRCSDYSYATRQRDVEFLQEEYDTAKILGIPTTFKKTNSLKFENHGYLEMKNQAKFHPLKYLSALTKIISPKVKIFEKTEALRIDGEDPYVVKTPNGFIKANYVIVATYSPFNHKLYFKKATYKSYVIEAKIPPKVLPEAMFEDMLNPYHYFRVDRKGSYDRLIIGGEDHRKDIPVSEEKSFHALIDYMNVTFPKIKYKIIRKWSGPIMESVDGLAFIGALGNKRIFYATGFSGNGMTYNFIAADIIVSSIFGKMNKQLRNFASVYEAGRWYNLKDIIYKAPAYIQEFFGGAVKNTFKYIGD